MQWGRARQALVPDFRLQLPGPDGPTFSLAELKICGAGKSWFPRGLEGRGTDRRAAGLAKLYENNLAKYDSRYHGTMPGQHGPLVRRLHSFGKLWGLCVGPWGDCSRDLHHLIKVLGEQRVQRKERSQGSVRGSDHLGVVTGQIRHILSFTFVRANALCLLSRLSYMGPHARAAAERRCAAQRGQAARTAEAVAHWHTQVRDRGLSRVCVIRISHIV